MSKTTLAFRPLNKVSVVTAGDAVPLSATSIEAMALVVKADKNNQGPIYLGEADVAAGKCIPLEPGESIEIVPDDSAADQDRVIVDLSQIWIDSAANGDGVFLAYMPYVEVNYRG